MSGAPAAKMCDDALSRTRSEFRWRDRFNLSLDPGTAEQYHDLAIPAGRRQDRPLLLDVRAQILCNEDHSGVRDLAAKGMAEMSGACRVRGAELYLSADQAGPAMIG